MYGFLRLYGFISAVLWLVPQFSAKELPIYTWELYRPGRLIWDKGECTRDVKMVVGVMSAMENFAQRSHVRRTWGRHAKRLGVKVVFMLGTTHNISNRSQAAVNEESAIHCDMVLGAFVDKYRHLTLKVLSLLEWVLKYCSHALWLFKTDDDVFLYLLNIINFLKNIKKNESAIWGYIRIEGVSRDRTLMNYVSYVQYPWSTFPPFTTGSAYVMPTSIVQKIFDKSLHTAFIPLEDVFFTGIVAMDLEIPRIHNRLFQVHFNTVLSNPKGWEDTVLAVHTTSRSIKMWRLWHFLFGPMKAPTVSDALTANDTDYIL